MTGPVLLVHGIGSTFEHNWVRSGWVDLLAEQDRDVVPVHLPGHGPLADSDTAGHPSWEAVLVATEMHPMVDAVGFSAGGYAVLTAAVRAPQRFARLAILGVGDAMLGDRSAGRMALAGMLQEDEAAPDPQVRMMRRMITSAGNDVGLVARQMGASRNTVTDEQLAAVRCPVLIVLGERDFAGPAARLVAGLPDARLVTLPGVDHFATTSDVGCINAVLDFLCG